MVDDGRLTVEYWPLQRILPYAENARTHPDEQVEQLVQSILNFGFTQPCLVDAKGELVAGHGRLLAAKKLGLDEVPVIRLGHLTAAQARAYRLADNRIALNSAWDEDMLRKELAAINTDFDLAGLGFDVADLERLLTTADTYGDSGHNAASPDQQQIDVKSAGSLAEKFGVPPFSVLRAAEGWWQKRKAQWIAMGIESELGRGLGNQSAPGGSMMPGVDRKTGKIVRTDSHARPVAA